MDSALGASTGDSLCQQVHHSRSEHVHSEKAKVVTGAQAGYNQSLFGFGRRRFFDDFGEFEQAVAPRHQSSADGSVEGEFTLVFRLHGRDAAGLSRGNFDELLRAAFLSTADVKMIANQQEKWGAPDKLPG